MKQRNTKAPKGNLNSTQNKLPNSKLRQEHSALPNPVDTVGKPNTNARKIARVILYMLFLAAVGITFAFFIFMISMYVNA